MSIPVSAAASAYGNAARLIDDSARAAAGGAALPAAGAGGGEDFASMLSQAVQGVADAGNRSDQVAIDMLEGNASVVDMVTAVAETELAVETMVTVRDKVISAYQEIMRMPI